MREGKLKLIFWISALIMLVAMLIISRDAGISGDEEVHYKQSEMVYDYLSSFGTDKSALDTPKTNLKYYGQAYDNLTTILIHWFQIDDIYSFRHLAASFSGWLTILVTALFAAWIAGYGAAILVLLLFAVSPNFLGHAQNNLKDIPFALAYISSIFYSLKLVFTDEKPTRKTIVLLTLSMAFSFGIRAGGILVFFYLGLFFFLKVFLNWKSKRSFDLEFLKKRLLLIAAISLAAYLTGLITWPFGLENPLVHPWKSFQIMNHYPITVRQIFEGKFEWSDYLPWYYLPKYMVLTIPVLILAGIPAFFLNLKKNYTPKQQHLLILVGFTILFPLVFVLLKQSNLYGSWRHFLFLYPGIVLISALGIHALFRRFKQTNFRRGIVLLILILSFHPLKFMAANHPYYYLYYNQFTGGLKGAYGNYETDYYYHSMREGAEWLQEYLKNKPDTSELIVGGNFPSHWFFRNEKRLKFVYFTWQNRSKYDWDYAIVANSYIPPFQLKNKIWPPENAIHTIFADGIPVCAVIERVTKDDLRGFEALEKGDYIKSALLFRDALENDSQNELICYSFAESLLAEGENTEAEQWIQKSLELNPDFDKALVLYGDLAIKQKNENIAVKYYQKAIAANRKYFPAYTKLAKVYEKTDTLRARQVLKECLKINSRYKPALQILAGTYRETDPATAGKYDEIIKRIK